MKAARRDRYGGPEVVEVHDVDKPVAGAGEVLVRVHSASVNWADLDALGPRWRFLRLFMGVRRPRGKTLGIDLGGVVEAVGQEVQRFKVGDRVFGDDYEHGSAAFAEFVSVPEKSLQLVPDEMPFEVAATLPHSAILALQGLRTGKGRTVAAGERVLIVGASGNVGPFCVQIAKSRGAHVTGVASARKLDMVRALGADEVIDYATVDYTRPAQPYDWIIDVDAHHPLRRWRGALTDGGVYVGMGGPGGWLLAALLWQPILRLTTGKTMGLMLHWKPFKLEDVAELLRLVQSGTVVPAIDRHFPLDQVADALRHVEEGRARGKVIIDVAGQGQPER